MSRTVYRLVIGCLSGVVAIAEAVVGYFTAKGFAQGPAVLASIPVAYAAAEQILLNFVDEGKQTKKDKK